MPPVRRSGKYREAPANGSPDLESVIFPEIVILIEFFDEGICAGLSWQKRIKTKTISTLNIVFITLNFTMDTNAACISDYLLNLKSRQNNRVRISSYENLFMLVMAGRVMKKRRAQWNKS